MRNIMRTPSRILFLIVVAVTLFISGIGIAASHRVNRVSPVDCAEDCAKKRDRMLEKCSTLPEAAQGNCRENASKQYDRCIERCNNGGGGSDTRPGN